LPRLLRTFALALVPLLLVSCAFIWNLGNRNSLEADVLEVLHPAPDEGSFLECRMIGTTRSGYCVGEISQADVQALTLAIGLESSTLDLADLDGVPPLAYEGLVGCLDPQTLAVVDGLPAYWIAGRPPQLALKSGGQFEYLLLIVNEATGQGCVQVSYAYG